MVVRESYGKGMYSAKTLSPEGIIVLTKRLTGFEDSETLERDRARRAARWQIEFALSEGPRSPLEAAESNIF